MKICNSIEDEKECMSLFGNNFFELTREEIMALLDGKTLCDPDFDEYGTFIRMEDTKND